MKNFILILISLLFIGCSAEKLENSLSKEDNFLLTEWGLSAVVFNGIPNTLTDCEKQAYITFFIDGTFKRSYYYSNSGTCLSEGLQEGTYLFDVDVRRITLRWSDVTGDRGF